MTPQSYIEALENCDNHARRLITELSPEQLMWRPRNSASWSIAECINHLAITNQGYLNSIREALQSGGPSPGQPELRPTGIFGSFMVRTMEPPARVKVKAPAKIAPVVCAPADSLNAFLKSNQDVITIIRMGERIDLNRIKFRNPFIPLVHFTIATGLLIIAAHERRHLWQADQIRNNTN